MLYFHSCACRGDVALADLGDEVIIEEFIDIVIGLPAPIEVGEGIVHILGPGVHDALAARCWAGRRSGRRGRPAGPLTNSWAVRLKLAML